MAKVLEQKLTTRQKDYPQRVTRAEKYVKRSDASKHTAIVVRGQGSEQQTANKGLRTERD